MVVDVFLFPLINTAIFGFISLYLLGDHQDTAAHYVLMGMILWQIIWVISYSVAVGSLWNIWSRNLSNMFVAPLKVKEYVLAHFLSGILKALLLLIISACASQLLFRLNLLDVGIIPLVLVFVIFAIFAFSMGIAILGLIFRFGTRIQALSWSLVMIFQPLSAAFYPLSVMPQALQMLARCFPPTYAFEGARYALTYHTIDWSLFGSGLALDALYCVACIFLFRYMFDTSRDTGQFARNES